MAYLEFEETNILKAFLVLQLALMQRHLDDLDFLIQKRHLVVATDELLSDYVSLLYHLQQQ